jgi:hypothetical protein
MEFFTLEDLLMFWQRQMKDGFRVIEALVNLIEYPNLTDEQKHEVILETLHKYGLYEIDYEGERGDFLIGQSEAVDTMFEVDDDSEKIKEDKKPGETQYQVEIYSIKLMNGRTSFTFVLN